MKILQDGLFFMDWTKQKGALSWALFSFTRRSHAAEFANRRRRIPEESNAYFNN